MLTSLACGSMAYGIYDFLDSKFQVSHDIATLARLLPYAGLAKRLKTMHPVDVFNSAVTKFSSLPALISAETGHLITYQQVDVLSNQVANWALSNGMQRGDTVALFMSNRMEFIITWLGLSKIGITTAWINFNIKSKGLMHCIRISKATTLIYGTELIDSINLVSTDLLNDGLTLLSMGTLNGPPNSTSITPGAIDQTIIHASQTKPDTKHRDGLLPSHPFCYIYTSGTTGLPKAVVIPIRKYASISGLGSVYMKPGIDRNYCVLPLFHSAGGMMGGAAFLAGVSMIIKNKFSASQFFEDCIKYDATVTQYIGELCRYLVARKPSDADTKHNIRLAIGNGLRPDIWDEFQDRFQIPDILEFYGATEGTGSTLNYCTTKEDRGAVGTCIVS